MKTIDVFEKVRKGESIELEDIYFLANKLKVKKEGRVVRLLRGVEKRIITPREAVEIIEDETDVVVLENQP